MPETSAERPSDSGFRSRCGILEASLRAVLFQRRGKRISLSSAGLLFQEHARAILRRSKKSLQELSSGLGELEGTLRVGVIPYLNVALMPMLLGRFNQEHPGIDLSILESLRPRSRPNWRKGKWTSASCSSRVTHPIEEPPKSPRPFKLRQPTREHAKPAASSPSEHKDVQAG
jgi:hypothetical protein